MSVSFLAAGVATAVAAAITAMLVVRFARLPRLDQAAWACAAAGLTVALAAQALGYHRGFNAAAFRAIEVGARLAAPLALGLQVKLPVTSGYAAICLIAAALTWFAGDRSRRVRLADLHEIAPAGDDTGWGEAYTDTGYGLYRPDTGAMRRIGSDTDFGGRYRPDTGGFGRGGSGTDLGGLYPPEGTRRGPGRVPPRARSR